MYHERFKGTHYESGFLRGKRLREHGKQILEQVPFPISEERIRYAVKCRPYYEKWYPEALEEIRGIADGQGTEAGKLEAVLLSMYGIMPENRCSCLAFRQGGHVILARNSDFLTETEKLNMNCIFRLDGAYHFQGNTTAFVEMEDGVNEYGFAVGLTSVYPSCLGCGLNAGMLLRYGLERCRTVKDFVNALRQLPVATSQTFTAVDRTGTAAVIECNVERTEVCYAGQEHMFVSAVNAFNLDGMKRYRTEGMDDWEAQRRYETMQSAFVHNKSGAEEAVPFAMDVMRGRYGFICQYDRRTGKDTVWSAIYDVGAGKLWRCEGNPSRKAYKEDGRFGFLEQTSVQGKEQNL